MFDGWDPLVLENSPLHESVQTTSLIAIADRI